MFFDKQITHVQQQTTAVQSQLTTPPSLPPLKLFAASQIQPIRFVCVVVVGYVLFHICLLLVPQN
jgi:hypothetical protein